MVIGVLRVELLIAGSNSLKEKRMVIRSLKDKLRNSFNISVAEVDLQDKWQRAVIGIASVCDDQKYLNGQLDRVIDFIERFNGVEISDYQMEFS